MHKYLKLLVLIALSIVFIAQPGNTAAQYNQPGLKKTLIFPGSETAPSRKARGGPKSFELPIPPGATEAPTGLDRKTNGLVPQEKFNEAAEEFADVETVAEGLGPLRNGDSCADCHRNPFGGFGTTVEINAGHNEKRDGKLSGKHRRVSDAVGKIIFVAARSSRQRQGGKTPPQQEFARLAR